MHPTLRWLTAAIVLSLTVGCSARGGGGGGGNLPPVDANPTGDAVVLPGDLGFRGERSPPRRSSP